MYFDGEPSAGCLFDLCIFEAEEAGDGGAGEVNIENPNGFAGKGEGESELRCYRGFADAAFARKDLTMALALGLLEDKWAAGVCSKSVRTKTMFFTLSRDMVYAKELCSCLWSVDAFSRFEIQFANGPLSYLISVSKLNPLV